MRILIAILATAAVVGVSLRAVAEEAWTPIPNCGSKIPAANDIISNSTLWQCAKSQFAQSQAEYDVALKSFAARIPDEEQALLRTKVDSWNRADQAKCTKQDSLDFGCAIEASYSRARMLDTAADKCMAGSCHSRDLP